MAFSLHVFCDVLALRCFGSLGFRLLVLVLAAAVHRSNSFAIFGYVPEYSFNSVDWYGAAQHTTHLILFSVEPGPDGDIVGMDRFWNLRQSSSPLRLALQKAGSRAPKVLLTLGGTGRSQHFQKVTADKKLRKKLARKIRQLLTDYPILAGIDFNWESPRSVEDWRNLGKLVQEVRAQIKSSPVPLGGTLLTLAYHPLSGSVEHFAGLVSKQDGQSFVGFFDYFHAMSYSKLDENKRHATQKTVKIAMDEWSHYKLPSRKLTIGLPFFGVSMDTQKPKKYGDIVGDEPSLKQRLDVDETADKVYFNNGNTLAKKVRYAMKRELGGVMIWELGQDKASSDPNSGSLLRQVFSAAVDAASKSGQAVLKSSSSGAADFWAWLPVTEDNIFAGIAGVIGAYLLLKVAWFHTHPRYRAPRGENDPPAEPSAEHLKRVDDYEAARQKAWDEHQAAEAARQKAADDQKPVVEPSKEPESQENDSAG